MALQNQTVITCIFQIKDLFLGGLFAAFLSNDDSTQSIYERSFNWDILRCILDEDDDEQSDYDEEAEDNNKQVDFKTNNG